MSQKTSLDLDPLQPFHPAVRRWFEERIFEGSIPGLRSYVRP